MDRENNAMKLHEKAERLIEERARGSRTRFASAMDAIALALIAGGALYLAVRPRFMNRAAALFVTAVCLVLAALTAAAVTREARIKRAAAIRRELKEKLLRAKLCQDPGRLEKELERVSGACFVPKAEELTSDDVLEAYRKFGTEARIVTFAQPTGRALELIKLLGIRPPAKPFEALDVGPEEFACVTEEETDRAALALFQKQKRPRLRGLPKLLHERAFKFILLGAALYALSFAVRYQLTYRIFALLALGIGGAFSAGDRLKRRA